MYDPNISTIYKPVKSLVEKVGSEWNILRNLDNSGPYSRREFLKTAGKGAVTILFFGYGLGALGCSKKKKEPGEAEDKGDMFAPSDIEQTIEANKPTITGLRLNVSGRKLTAEWDALDADGDIITKYQYRVGIDDWVDIIENNATIENIPRGEYTFSVRAYSNEWGLIRQQVFSIENQPPSLTVTDPRLGGSPAVDIAEVYEGSELRLNVLYSDPDGDAVNLTADGLSELPNVRWDPSTGKLQWVPNDRVRPGEEERIQITFRATDGTASTTKTIDIVVLNFEPPQPVGGPPPPLG